MRTYLKCVWWNKFTLAGYVCMVSGSVATFSPSLLAHVGIFLFLLGFLFLLCTLVGLETYDSYQRAVMLLKNGHFLALEEALPSAAYCNAVGIRGALEENKKRGGQ
jgi:Zn-dependent membrane protease YugP